MNYKVLPIVEWTITWLYSTHYPLHDRLISGGLELSTGYLTAGNYQTAAGYDPSKTGNAFTHFDGNRTAATRGEHNKMILPHTQKANI